MSEYSIIELEKIEASEMRDFSMKVMECETWEALEALYKTDNPFSTKDYRFNKHAVAGKMNAQTISKNLINMFSVYYPKLYDKWTNDKNVIAEIANMRAQSSISESPQPRCIN